MIRQPAVPSLVVGLVKDSQLLFEYPVENPVTSRTPGPKLVGPLRAVDGVGLMHSKPVQLGLDQLFLLMEPTIELQLFLGALAELAGEEVALRDNQLDWTVVDENRVLLATLHRPGTTPNPKGPSVPGKTCHPMPFQAKFKALEHPDLTLEKFFGGQCTVSRMKDL